MPYIGKKPADIIATAVDTTTGTFSGVVDADAGITVDNITIDGTEIDLSSGDLTLDVAGDIILDADGGDIKIKDGGTEFGSITNSSSELHIKATVNDKDIVLAGLDGGAACNALRLDMSDAGTASFNHDILLGDNGVIRLGAGPDLLIYHDGSHSYVQDNGTGNIRIQGANIEMVDNDDGGSLLQAVQGGAVTLYHNNSAKLDTTSSGVNITGTMSADNQIFIEGATNDTARVNFGDSDDVDIGFISYNNADNHMQFATNTAERMRIDSSGKVSIGHGSPTNNLDVRSSGQVGLTLGSTNAGGAIIALDGDSNGDVSGSDYSYIHHNTDGRIDFVQDSPSSSNTNEIRFYTLAVERFRLKNSEAVFNEAGNDVDFRVEGDGESHALSLRASDDRVAVGGTGTYQGKFTVNSTINNNSGCAINSTASDFSASVMDLSTLRNTTNGTYFFLSASITGVQTKVRVQDSGNFLNINNSYGAISDEKLKENIADSSSQWDDIKAIKVRKYSMKEDNLSSANRIGVVAQELETAGLNNLVEEIQEEKRDTNEFLEDGKTPNPYYWQIIGKEETTTKSVKYSVLYMKAVKALQEAMARIETLEAKVTALEGA